LVAQIIPYGMSEEIEEVTLQRVHMNVTKPSFGSGIKIYRIMNGEEAGELCKIVRFCNTTHKDGNHCFNVQNAGNGYCHRHNKNK